MTTTNIFTETWLPNRPMVTNDFRQGLKRTSHQEALDYKWVETNPRTYKNVLSFDLDEDEAESKLKTLVYDDEKAPEPSWVTFNPHSGHAHVGYVLEAPVGSQRGLAYFQDVRTRLNTLLGADEAYKGYTMRNPLVHPTSWMSDKLWTLKELDGWTKTVPQKVEKTDKEVAGRNDLMFESLRNYGYSAYRRLGWDATALRSDLEAKALEFYYSEIEDHAGFPLSEVMSVVKSVWKWITQKHTKEAFAKIQGERSRKRWGTHTQDNDPFVIMLKEEMGFTFQEMADNLGMSASGAKTAYYRAKRRQA